MEYRDDTTHLLRRVEFLVYRELLRVAQRRLGAGHNGDLEHGVCIAHKPCLGEEQGAKLALVLRVPWIVK